MRPLPNKAAVSVNLFNSMEWNRCHFSTQLYLKGEMISLFEYDLLKGYTDDFFFPVVFVADLEVTFPEFFVPADFIEQILNGDHVENSLLPLISVLCGHAFLMISLFRSSTRARMCAGVDPQHPPIMFAPASTSSLNREAIFSGDSR